MRKLFILSASLATLTAVPTLALADTDIVIKPEVDTWVMEQPDTDSGVDIDLNVGTSVPDNVTIVNAPDDRYGYVVVKKKRVLIDRKNRKVVKIYK